VLKMTMKKELKYLIKESKEFLRSIPKEKIDEYMAERMTRFENAIANAETCFDSGKY